MTKRIIFKILLVALVVFTLEGALHIWGLLYLRNLYSTHISREKINPESQTILCLGESSTIGIWVNPGDSYPVQLERMLREYYNSANIHVLVPPHIGQNTSQMANRMHEYITLYNPKVIVMMVGCNNHWSLAESHISRFLPSNSINAVRMKIFIFFNKFHLFKLIRYLYLCAKYEGRHIIESLSFKEYIAGAPQRMHYLPSQWVLDTFNHNIGYFNKLWRYDVASMINSAKKFNIPVIFMTYPMSISVPTEEFLSVAEKEGLYLIRNDLNFDVLKKRGELSDYIFSKDNWHPTKKGYAIVARNVFDVIVKNELLSSKYSN